MYIITLTNINNNGHTGIGYTKCFRLCFAQLRPFAATVLTGSATCFEICKLNKIKGKRIFPLFSPVINHQWKTGFILLSSSSITLPLVPDCTSDLKLDDRM